MIWAALTVFCSNKSYLYCNPKQSLFGCVAELRTCHPGYFQCGSGHCIADRFKCDGNADCLDYTDETSCREWHLSNALPNKVAFSLWLCWLCVNHRFSLTQWLNHFQRPASPMARTAPPSCLSAKTTYVFSLSGNVMETTTVETIQTRSFTSAVSNISTHKSSTCCFLLSSTVKHRIILCLSLLILSGHPVRDPVPFPLWKQPLHLQPWAV